MTSLSLNGATTTLYLQQSGANIQYSTDQSTWTTISSWPLNITNTNASPASNLLKVYFTTSLTLTGSTQYLKCNSAGIQFGNKTLNTRGSKPTITINNVTNYPGLIQNGTATPSTGYNSIIICNLSVLSSGTTTLANGGGWIAQSYFSNAATGCVILNCDSDGAITQYSGGISGQNTCQGSGSVTILGCSSRGAISGGGIVGNSCCPTGGTLVVSKCYSSGAIGDYTGGILGPYAGTGGGTITVSNCFSTGLIGIASGGIVGFIPGSASATTITVSNCYSTGSISNTGGGIYGNGALGTCLAINCYTTGTLLSGGSAGIFAASYSSGSRATNCYTTGANGAGAGSGIFAGSLSETANGSSNNYGECNRFSSGWNDTRAATYLSPASAWIQPDGTNQPYKLADMGYTPYSLINISASNTLVTTETASV